MTLRWIPEHDCQLVTINVTISVLEDTKQNDGNKTSKFPKQNHFKALVYFGGPENYFPKFW